jgi:NADH:ubiquinone oxidoreductase subunit K
MLVCLAILSILIFAISCLGVLKNRKWAKFFVPIPIIFIQTQEWFLIGQVSVYTKLEYFANGLLGIATGIFLCAAYWVLKEAEPTSESDVV